MAEIFLHDSEMQQKTNQANNVDWRRLCLLIDKAILSPRGILSSDCVRQIALKIFPFEF